MNPTNRWSLTLVKNKPTPKKNTLVIAACVAVYFGAYFVLVHPILAGPPERHVRIESYINPVTRCEALDDKRFVVFFWPAHRVDVLIRPGFWSPT
jgi:hypothetical protein